MPPTKITSCGQVPAPTSLIGVEMEVAGVRKSVFEYGELPFESPSVKCNRLQAVGNVPLAPLHSTDFGVHGRLHTLVLLNK